ncbi:unnamed protein product [Effrenium voratum]|nr:unnamed protein product [Effrenium voratum]
MTLTSGWSRPSARLRMPTSLSRRGFGSAAGWSRFQVPRCSIWTAESWRRLGFRCETSSLAAKPVCLRTFRLQCAWALPHLRGAEV